MPFSSKLKYLVENLLPFLVAWVLLVPNIHGCKFFRAERSPVLKFVESKIVKFMGTAKMEDGESLMHIPLIYGHNSRHGFYDIFFSEL